jgi:hypothetical protein
LIKGGQVRNEAYFNERKPQPTGDWNEVVVPLVGKGLVTNEIDHTHGTSTATVNITLMNILTTELFPRKEDGQAPAFGGI